MDGSHKRDVDDDNVPALEVPEYSIEHSGVLVVKPLDDRYKVVHDRRGRGFGDILDDFSYLSRTGVISVGFQEFYQLRPFVLLPTPNCIRPDLFPFLGRNTGFNHVTRSQRGQIEMNIARQEPLILLRDLAIGVDNHLLPEFW